MLLKLAVIFYDYRSIYSRLLITKYFLSQPGVQRVPVDEQVVAFVIVTKQSSQAHLDFNVHYLLNNGIRVCVCG